MFDLVENHKHRISVDDAQLAALQLVLNIYSLED